MLTTGSFQAMGTVNTVAVEDDALLPRAMAIAERVIHEIDEVCSRFKPDSELSRLNRSAGCRVVVSPLLEAALTAAFEAAAMTNGLVDPTVGRRVRELGYSVTYGAMPADGPAVELRVRQVKGWRAVELDPIAHTVAMPEDISLDLGASGKAWAADTAAAAAAEALGAGVLVECGGDVAVSGPPPGGGWPVRVAAGVGAPEGEDVAIHDGGLATSGTTYRRWRRGGVEMHDIIDPATGFPAQTPWAMVSVAAATCLEANAASTAALILSDAAPNWLDRLGLPSRLVHASGAVRYTGGWAGH